MSELLYQHLFKSLSAPILTVNSSGIVLDVNPAFISLFKVKKTTVIGNSLETIFTGIIPEKAITALLNKDKQKVEITLQHLEPVKSFYINNTASYEENGQILRFIIFNEKAESTELKNKINDLENDFQNEKRISIFGHLIPGIAHNINNPLAVIIGRSQLLNIKHPEIADLDSITEQAILIKSIIDALSFKISHELNDQENPISISDLLRNELSVLNADPFYKHKVQKQITLDDNTPLLKGLYRDFSTALLTVINFSLDSLLSAEKKTLSISTHIDSKYIVVNITDSGSMIETNDLEQGFPASVMFQSTRLGKFIINFARADELLSKYGGKISLQKNDPDGKIFQIKIPY